MNVGILIYPGFAIFEFSCALELFALPRPELSQSQWYNTKIVAWESGPYDTLCGIKVECVPINRLEEFDLLVVPSWNTANSAIPETFCDELVRYQERGGRIISFCSGAFLLAQAGLLENRQATTHWRYAQTFKERFPNVHYMDDVLYVYDGTIGCSAGSAAGLDLGIEVIRRDFGHDVANTVARRLVLPAHRQGGQKQYIENPVQKTPDVFSSTLDWAAKNIELGLSVDMLADKSLMSRRSFDRKFREKLNMSPKQWLIIQQVDAAKRLLESSTDTIDTVALKSGFENAVTLRHHFKRLLNISPTHYRVQFNKTS
ncbi:helix-turn-helix domain-containing protein [Sessilibacter corallicola]|uniref:Transcriptional regulator FtrA n=1 Tax=Sessilibacter corallicola TaxID=2904075 RepID=A0ABQ0ACF1_9GAMM